MNSPSPTWFRVQAKIVRRRQKQRDWLPVRCGNGPAVWLPREFAHFLAEKPTYLPKGSQ